jgi:hypothetical protein
MQVDHASRDRRNEGLDRSFFRQHEFAVLENNKIVENEIIR